MNQDYKLFGGTIMDKRHMFFLQLFADDDGAEGAEGSASAGDPDPAGKRRLGGRHRRKA